MAKFTRSGEKETPAISTASLPDIIFMLLFFFMVSTTMKDSDPVVTVRPVSAKEVTQLERKELVTNISIGKPIEKFQKVFGKEDRVELNGSIRNIQDIPSFIANQRAEIAEAEQNKMIVSLKIDKKSKMGIVTAVKQELRKASALKISYSALPKYE
ncbi:biopolymer transport protein ExbD [Balneicella halophila]|uniref:Biopolymer transport protein ExbD n=1 Tax=Balneicella halophila TaxID=1537566 RepID=A0A7L4US57_BALHA|nr:biopolymer transporter ExbD [Balneicella halophila]PVX52603.1 biopolymer transport protein ExbD [Balneicella halophila]